MILLHLIAGLRTGGIETWLTRVIPALNQLGHTNHILLTKGSNYDQPIVDELRSHATIHFLRRGSQSAIARELRSIVSNSPAPACVVNHMQATSLNGVLAAKRAKLKTLLVFHNVSFRAQGRWARVPGLRSLRSAYVTLTVPLAVRLSDRLGAISADVQATWFGDRDTQIIRYCVDPATLEAIDEVQRAEPWFTAHPTYRLLHIGRLVEQKNQSDLLKFFARIYAEQPASELNIAGSGPLLEDLQRECRELGIEGAVKFLGIRSDVPALFDNSFALVMTSHWEGLGLVCLEAAARGTPVLSYASPGLREAVVEGVTGSLVEPYDVSALQNRFKDLASDRARYEQLCHSAARYARQWASPAASAQSLLDALPPTDSSRGESVSGQTESSS